MKQKTTIWFLLVVLIVCGVVHGEAKGLQTNSVPGLRDLRHEVPEIGSAELDGEIVSITDNKIKIRNSNGTYNFRVASGAGFFCNGAPASWKALLPITDQAFFEARVSLDQDGRVIRVNGYYYGEECIIEGWRRENGLSLQVVKPDYNQIAICQVAPQARLPQGQGWLSEGQVVFLLYNFDGKIRGVYLPD